MKIFENKGDRFCEHLYNYTLGSVSVLAPSRQVVF